MKKIFMFMIYALLATIVIVAAAYFYVSSQVKITEKGVISTRSVPYVGIKTNDVLMSDFSKKIPETFYKLDSFVKAHPNIKTGKLFTIYQKSSKSENMADIIVGYETPQLYENIHQKNVFAGVRKSIIAMKFEVFGSYDYFSYVWVSAMIKVKQSEKYELNQKEFGFEVYETRPEDGDIKEKDYKTILYLPVVEK